MSGRDTREWRNGAAFDMHGRELGRLRPRSLRIHFSKETVSSYIFEIKKIFEFSVTFKVDYFM